MGHDLARDPASQVFVSLPSSRTPALLLCYSTPFALGLDSELVSRVSRVTAFGHLLAGVAPKGVLQPGLRSGLLPLLRRSFRSANPVCSV